MFGVAANVYRNEVRRLRADKRSTTEVTLGEEASEWDVADLDETERVVNRDALDRVERALRELPTPMRRPLTLYVYHGLRYRDIAQVLGITAHTVKSQIAEARKRLRGALESTTGSVN